MVKQRVKSPDQKMALHIQIIKNQKMTLLELRI